MIYILQNKIQSKIGNLKSRITNGFTLIELMIVIAIAIILIGAMLPVFGNLQSSAQLNESTSQLIQALRIAKERSVSNMNNSSHGIYLEADRYTLYQGSSYALRSQAYDREVILSDTLSIANNLAGSEVNFSGGLGVPNTTGSITLAHSVYGSKIITINSYGVVGEN